MSVCDPLQTFELPAPEGHTQFRFGVCVRAKPALSWGICVAPPQIGYRTLPTAPIPTVRFGE